MSRYIDADAFEVFGYNKTEGASKEYNDGFDDGVQYVLECIDNVPTADVTKVICCKDCFYAKPYKAKWQLPIKEDALWCTHHEEEKTQGWFCADAIERMVEDGKIH